VDKRRFAIALSGVIAVLFCAPAAFAAGEGITDSAAATVFLWVVIILLIAKLSCLVERIGQPPVLGELLAGVVLGNLALLGIDAFEPIKDDASIAFLARLGVVVLLFQVGLDSKLDEMRRVGGRAFLVASVGVGVPFGLGSFLVGPQLFPGHSTNFYLFLGATLTATSVGITARVFRDLGKLQTPEARIVLGAAVIDDVLGLIILAVVSAIVTVGAVSLETAAWISFKAILFLGGALVAGQLLVPQLNRMFGLIQASVAMKFTLALSFGLVMAFLADRIGLSPIVGAFAAGLVLEPVHFRQFVSSRVVEDVRECIEGFDPEVKACVLGVVNQHAERHVQDIIEPLGFFLVPIFFVVTGMGVKISSFLNVPILLLALALTVVAFAGKIVAGLVAGKVNKAIVGWGMAPRGEVGLIFAATGKSLGVVSDEIFSALVIVILLTTLLTPPILTFIIRRQQARDVPGSDEAPVPALAPRIHANLRE
jgi:Kef-type K+ transport system membrane component KefB